MYPMPGAGTKQLDSGFCTAFTDRNFDIDVWHLGLVPGMNLEWGLFAF